MKKIIALFITFLVLLPTSASADGSMWHVADGQLIEAYGLPDGGALILTIKADYQYQYLALTVRDVDGQTYDEQTMLPPEGIPETVRVSVCGQRMQVFASYGGDFNAYNSPVYQNIFELRQPSGICDYRAHVIYLPVVKQP